MESFRFRPRLERVEDRVTPAVTPTEVFGAAAQTEIARETLWGLLQHLDEPMNVYEKPFWAATLPVMVQQSRESHNVLADFRASLQSQTSAGDALAAALGPWVAQTQALQNQAALNALFAGVYATGFGVPLTAVFPTPVPPPPPGAPFPDGSGAPFPDNNGSTASDAGMTNTLPDVNAPDWRTQANGLKIWDVTEGTGTAVQPGDSVTVHYTGWLTNGTVFDSSRTALATRPGVTGDPVTFSLDQVIQGWQEGIPGMKPGGIRRLYVPAALGYGSAGTSTIPPNSDLVFEVKLISSTSG